MQNSRDAILASIEQSLRRDSGPAASLPHSPDLERMCQADDVQPDVPRSDLRQQFTMALVANGGTAYTVLDDDECAVAIASHMRLHDLRKIAVQSSPLAINIGFLLNDVQVVRAQDVPLAELALVDCALVEAVGLVADSGSAIVITANQQDRALPYLPRVCFIAAKASRMHRCLSLPAMQPVYEAAKFGQAGEAVIITGPSRTADIEKILILGAHGPESVLTFLIESSR